MKRTRKKNTGQNSKLKFCSSWCWFVVDDFEDGVVVADVVYVVGVVLVVVNVIVIVFLVVVAYVYVDEYDVVVHR